MAQEAIIVEPQKSKLEKKPMKSLEEGGRRSFRSRSTCSLKLFTLMKVTSPNNPRVGRMCRRDSEVEVWNQPLIDDNSVLDNNVIVNLYCPIFFLQRMTYIVRVGYTTWALSKTNRIGDTKYNI